MAEQVTSSQMAGWGAAASGIAAIGSAYAQSSSYKVQEIQAKTAARMAQVQGKSNALQMMKRYNKAAGQDVVMAAAQGRRGGSVDAIASAAREQLNWDTMFNEISTGISIESMSSQAEQFKIAGNQALIGGGLSSIAGISGRYASTLYDIGDKDKKDK